MDGNKRIKNRTLHIILPAAGAVMIIAALLIIPFIHQINEGARIDTDKDTDISYTVISDSTVTDMTIRDNDTRDVLTEVPEHISGRGVILRGPATNADRTSRTSPGGDYIWYEDYRTDCNLDIDGTDQDIQDFAHRFDEDPGFPMPEEDFPPYYCAGIEYEGKEFGIYRTEYITWECSNGYYRPSEPGLYCDTPLFFDPSGRYVFTMVYHDCDQLLLEFLEPVMSEVEVIRPDGSAGSSEDPALISCFLDAFHTLSAIETEDDMDDILASGDLYRITFTTETGLTHDYYLTEDSMMVYGAHSYQIGDAGDLFHLLDDPYTFFINAD